MTILDLGISFLYMLIVLRCMTAVLGSGQKNVFGCVGWIIYYIFLLIINLSTSFPSLITLLGQVLFIFFISTVTKRNSLKQRCIFALMLCATWIPVVILTMPAIGSTEMNQAMTSNVRVSIFMIWLLFLSSTLNASSQRKFSSFPCFRHTSVILLVTVSITYIIYKTFLISAAHEELIWFSTITHFLLLLISYVIFEGCEQIYRNIDLLEQNRLYEQQINLYYRQTTRTQDLYQKIQQSRHDIKYHLFVLLGMIRSNQEEAENYIQQLLNDTVNDRIGATMHSGNIIIDALVNHYDNLTQKENIRFDTSVFIPATLPFHDRHLTVILGNLLENALEACRQVELGQRYICLEITFEKKMLLISLRNSCIPVHRKDKTNRFRTTKPDSLHHGLGLSSIKQTVAYYQGEVMIENIGAEFHVKVILYGTNNFSKFL